jgi:hypothetical protein
MHPWNPWELVADPLESRGAQFANRRTRYLEMQKLKYP